MRGRPSRRRWGARYEHDPPLCLAFIDVWLLLLVAAMVFLALWALSGKDDR